ncbi:hypothetical protein H2201_008646 [Coniosporium apollinis]|uniref:Aminoglycoside phosphotransferase domain-containing protein n=1 Tax=Coniosporium apollinis TaxID=61459 RepID=A0ABQ9NGG2_9PEZI|nr:hypothetical protein H2201_008646 [Coniosporium apollinis]
MAQEPTSIGSDAWTNGKEYENEFYAARIEQVQKAFNQSALTAYASLLRDGRACTLSSNFSVGSCNFVKKITFDDEVEWIVSHHTDIPLPKVHGYNLDDSNPVGLPISIIDYVRGNTAEEVSRAYPGDHQYLPEEHQEKFWRQIAKVMVQLASIRLPKIGSIIRDPSHPGSFTVGPIVETSTGPFDSAAEFYDDFPLAQAKMLFGAEPRSSRLRKLGKELAEAFWSLASSSFSPSSSQDGTASRGFGLVNWELGTNNVLVDKEFNVLAIIDWDTVIAAPDAVLHFFPFLMGMESAVPGIVGGYQEEPEREQSYRRFAEVVEEVSLEQSAKQAFYPYSIFHTGLYGLWIMEHASILLRVAIVLPFDLLKAFKQVFKGRKHLE